MKITIIGPASPYRGGIALFSNRLAEALIADGNEVSIFTFKLQYPNFLFPGKTQFTEEVHKDTINTTRAINSVNPFNWTTVGKQIAATKPHLVIFKYWMPFMAPCFGTIAKYIHKNNTTKIVALVHNLIPHEKHSFDKLLSNYFVKHMDGFIAMTDSVMNDIKKLDKLKPSIISPHPLYDNFGNALLREDALKELKLAASFRYLLFFGIIRKYKGLDLLLEAFADKRLNDGALKLIVAGEFYEDEAPYLDIIKKHQLEDKVIIANHFIPDNEVANYFCAADIIVQPYKHATQSGVTQIAYHFNKPMLVTDVGGLKEIVPHHKVGYVVQPNKDDVANALVDFFQNNRAEEFIKGVKEEKEKYAWQKMVDSINLLFRKL